MAVVEWTLLAKTCRHILGLLAWTWAILLFSVGYFAGDHDDQPPILRNIVLPVFKVLLVAPAAFNLAAAQQPGSAGHHGNVQAGAASPPLLRLTGGLNGPVVLPAINTGNQVKVKDPNSEPATQQHLTISENGQYSFGYSAANSARKERRNPDGSVEGFYSYWDPTGKFVKIDYTADALGFKAYGDNVPPQHIIYPPYPVEDTPEVAQARAEFLEQYQRVLKYQQELHAKENATKSLAASPQQSGTQGPEETSPDSDSTDTEIIQPGTDYSDDVQAEVVIASDDVVNDEFNTNNVFNQTRINHVSPPVISSPIYNVQYVVGNQHGGVQSSQSISIPSGDSTAPGYFYYVGVGGLPYYVTSPARFNIPVSMRASSLGAIPVAAVHDAQTPHYGGSVLKTKSFPPLYVEIGHDYAGTGTSNIPIQTMKTVQVNQNKGSVVPVYPLYFPYVGYPVNSYQK